MTLDTLLDKMELFKQHEESMLKRGVKQSTIRRVANPKDRYVFFKKKTDRNYGGECEHYRGYYLDGVCGAVSCSAVEFLLPGVIRELYCKMNHESCLLQREVP